MTVAYWQIVRVLWRSDAIPGHSEIASSSATLSADTSSMSEYTNLDLLAIYLKIGVDAGSYTEVKMAFKSIQNYRKSDP